MAGATQYIPAALTVASALTSSSGSNTSASGAAMAAEGARVAAARTAAARKFEAEQLRVNAGQEIAAGQQAAFEQERQARLVASRQIALAAASGAGASDPTVKTLISRTAKQGSYNAAVALYQGQDKARALRMAAEGKDYEAAAALDGGDQQSRALELQARGYRTQGLGALLRGGSSLFARYGMGGAKASGDEAAVSSGAPAWDDAVNY